MRNARPVAILAALCCVSVAQGFAQSDSVQAPSTLDVYQSLVTEAVTGLCTQLRPRDSLKTEVSVEPAGPYWFIEEALTRAMRDRSLVPVLSGGEWRIQCAVKSARVDYSNLRREGIFGGRALDRTTALTLWLRVSDTGSARYLYDEEWQSQHTDTIALSDVERVEHPGVTATHGTVPSEGFFSSWLEPLILVGAIGVAVFMLFTTRS
jgi:hypothetical protein